MRQKASLWLVTWDAHDSWQFILDARDIKNITGNCPYYIYRVHGSCRVRRILLGTRTKRIVYRLRLGTRNNRAKTWLDIILLSLSKILCIVKGQFDVRVAHVWIENQLWLRFTSSFILYQERTTNLLTGERNTPYPLSVFH